ncbi:MAG: HYR domain-containing protein [Draconibacterium sp.]
MSCFGGNDGVALVTPSGGTSPYSITPSQTGLSAGTHTFLVTDANGCTTTVNVTITQPVNLTATGVQSQSVSCFGGNDGVALVTPSGGTSPYSITPSQTGLSAGTHTFLVTDANGCTTTVNVTITQPANLTATGVQSQTVSCFGGNDGVALVTPSGGTSPYSITPSQTGLTAGLHTFLITDDNGCTTTVVVTITQPAAPLSASASITSPILCFGETATIQVSASGGTAPYTYNFDVSSNNNGIFTGITGSVAGTVYNWHVTDANGCTTTVQTLTVTQPPQLTASASAPDVTCNGGTTTVTIVASGGTAPLSYTLNGVTKTNGTFSGITAGTYNWSVTDVNSCGPVTGTITINQPAAVTITSAVITTPIACFGGTATVTIQASGGNGTYNYTFNGQTNSTGIFTGVYAGTDLSYSVADSNGCGPVFGSITITQPTAITATAAITSPILCNGGTATVTITASGGTGALSYTFNGTTQASNVFTGIIPGTNIPWSVTDANGCGPVTGTLTVTQPVALTASVAETTPIACFGGTAEIRITSSGGTGSKTYVFNGVSNTTGIFPGVTAQTGYVWSVTDANGCSVSGTYDVAQPTQIVINSIGSNSAICQGATLTLNSSATGGTGTLRYSWTGPNGYSVNNSQNPVIPNAGTIAQGYYVLTVVDANNCSKKDSVFVTINPSPDVIAANNNPAFCSGGITDIDLSSSVGSTTFVWTVDSTGVSGASDGNGASISQTLTATGTVPGTVIYTITPTSPNGCIGEPEEVTVTVNPDIELTITNNTPTFCGDGNVSIVLQSNVSGTTFHWNYSNGTPGSGNIIDEFLSSTYNYTIYAEANGCYSDTLTTTVLVIDDEFDLEVNTTGPNAVDFCPGETFDIDFTGSSSGSGSWTVSTGRWTRTEYQWETRFFYSVSNPNIVVTTTGGPINNGSPANINFELLNVTSQPQTATISITPWAYQRSRDCWRFIGWNCNSWSAWSQLCAGPSYEVEITVQPFTITCPSDITANTDLDNCFAELSPGVPVTTCPTNALLSWDLINSSGTDSGNGVLSNYSFIPGTTTVTYTAEDNGEYRTCSFDVTITDNQDPTINCPATDTTIYATAGQCGVIYDFSHIQADDNCTVDQFLQTEGPASGSVFPVGTTTLSFYAEDESGNNATCSFNVIVVDTISPTINCVVNQTVCAEPGMDYTNIGIGWNATVADNCSGVTVAYTVDGTPVGNTLNNIVFTVAGSPHTVVVTATDANSNVSSCSFDVVINQSPAVTSDPVSQSVCLNGSVTFSATATGTPAPTFQWYKDGVALSGETGVSLTINPVSGADAGNYTVEVANSCGTAISTPALLTVSSAPFITVQPASQSDCKGNGVEFSVEAAGGNLPYVYLWEIKRPADAGFTDASVVPNITVNNGLMTVANVGNPDNPDQTQYRVIVTDNCGNKDTSAVAILTINEIDAVVLALNTICEGEGTSFSVTTSGSTPVLFEWIKHTGPGVWVPVVDGGVYSGATTATLTINNATVTESGDYSVRATFNITVPNNNGSNTCRETDYTEVGTLTVDPGPQIVAIATPAAICPGGNVTIKIYDANGAAGVTYSWSRTNATVLTGSFTETTVSDTLFLTGSLNSVSPATLLDTRFDITGATVNGCESTQQVTVNVGDDEMPTVESCTADITTGTTAGICGAVVNYTLPAFADNCDGTGLTGTQIAGLASGDTFPIGTTTVTYDFTDAAGNGPVSCSFDVTVTDDTDPTAVCQNITVQLDAAGNATITTAGIDNGSTDNCGVPTLSLDITTFDCSTIGLNTVTLTVTDASGNTATCTATVTVEDNIDPAAVCQDITAQLDAAGNVTISANDIDNSSSDNCGIASLILNQTDFNCTDVGANTVILTATDNNGNTATCSATITIEDTIPPTALCKDITVQLNATGNATITATDINNGSTDNCSIASTVISQTDFNCTHAGNNTVTLTVTDVNGNAATCAATVTVQDTVNPVAVCQNITVQLDATGNTTITPAQIDNGSSDNCGTPTLSLDETDFDCTELGANTVILTVTDGYGNTATCTAVVTVDDTDNPVDIAATVMQQDTLCLDDPTVVNIAITGGVGTIEYTFNGVTNGTGQFTVPAGYSYNWSVSNSLGCGTTTGTFLVEVHPVTAAPVFTAGAATLCQDAPNETYTATAVNSLSITYSVAPAGAGTINASTGEMDWDAAFSGTATITATATGHCNTETEDFTVNITPTVGTPTAITVAAGTEPTCQLTNATTTTTYSTTATNSTGFNWSISDGAAGSIDPATGEMTWADGFSGTVDIQVTADGCNGPSAMVSRTVNITPTVGTPTVPTPADSTICQGSSPTTFTTFASDAVSYNWTVSGAGNSISGTGTSAVVTWDAAFSGIATVSVTAEGCNGPSAEASTTVNVLPTPEVTMSAGVSVCQNTSPDPEITFTNPQSLPVTLTYNIDGAIQTINIPANSTATVTNATTNVGDFVYTLESVQYQSGPGCVNLLSGSSTITIRPEAPVAPGPITGNDFVLPVSSETYSIDPVTNATSYTWSVPSGWTIVSGQGTTSITVTTGIAGDTGDISVIAQNDCGDSPATTLPVDVNPNLAIITQPVSQSDCFGSSVLFSVSISGGAVPIVYTWQRKRISDAGFTDISGDPDITFPVDGQMLISNIGSVSNPDGTQYRVRITDNGGSDLISDGLATLTVNEVLTMSPADVTTEICEGENAAFSATTGGETPISMRWEKDGVPVSDDAVISGSATTNISFTGARPSDAGEYRLTVTFPMTQPNNDSGNPDNCTIISILYRTLVVNPLPVLAGPAEVCVGQTINWTPNIGGTWTSSDPAIATITDAGLITGIAEGTVSFTFTEIATGCSSTSTPVTVHPLPTGVIADNSAICAGDSTNITVTLTGTAPWDFTYSDGTTSVTLSGISTSPHTIRVSPSATATYNLTAVNDAYCDATSLTGSAVVTVYPLPTAILSGDATVCIGSSAGLTVDLTGAQPWSITYTDGITPVTITGITSTPYLLSVAPDSTTVYSLIAVSDIHCSGTSFSGTATVTVDQLPVASAGGSQTICSNGTATVSGATAENGTIAWTHNGAGSLSDSNTPTPTYTADVADNGNTITLTLIVTSNNTCLPTADTAIYQIFVDPLPEASAGGSATICTGGTVTVSGATAANGTVLWTHNGTGTISDETTLTPSYVAGSGDSGSVVALILIVTSDNACTPQTNTDTFFVNVLPEAQVDQPVDQEVCTGEATDMITFTTTNTIGTTTYTWTNSEPSIGLAASGTSSFIAPFTAINTGTDPIVATIEVTPHLTNNGVTCDGPPKTFTITVNPVPVAVAPIGLTFCNDILSDTFALSGTPSGVVFDISGGASIGLPNATGVTSILPFLPVAGTASITIIPRYNGCSGLPVSFNVTVRPTPVVTIAGGDTICQNSAPPGIIITNPMTLTVQVTYTINGTTTNTVNVPGRSNVSVAVPTNTAGTFVYNLVSVQYLDSNPPTCANTSITGTVTVEVVALPVPVITGPTDICAETSGHVYVTEGGMSNYTWTISAAGVVTAGGTAADSSVTVTWNTGGSQNISVRYNNTNGCAASTPTVFPVNVFDLPIPTITGSTSACEGSSKEYSTQPGMTSYLWTVSTGGTITAGGGLNDHSVTITWDSTGVQNLSVNYTSPDGCDASAPSVKNITINPLPEPTLTGPDTVCAGTTGNVYTTEAAMSTYVWTVSSGGTITAGGSANSSSVTVRWNNDGPQSVSVSYINPATGCSPDTATVLNVLVDPKPVPTITGSAGACAGSTGVVYTTEPGMTAYDWTISAGGVITAGGDGSDSVMVTWTTAGANTVRVNYANANGCSATTPTTKNVTVYALPVPVVAGSDEVCLGSTINYTTVAGMTNYQWIVSAGGTIVSGGSSTDNQVRVTWNTPGNETIALNYTNANGCYAADSTVYAITVYDLPSPTITGPADVCAGGSSSVYTTETGMTGYTWSVTGGTIVGGGNGIDSVVVVWNTAGAQTVSVNYYNANNCAAAVPFEYPVNVIAPAPPTCPANMNICSDDAPFVLSGATPVGGVYSGAGVSLSGTDYLFDPAAAGPGNHTISYTIANICADYCTFTITVTETPVGTDDVITICSGTPADFALIASVPGTVFSWTSTVTAGSVSGNTSCLGSCGTMITDTLINNSVVAPGASGTNAVVEYTVTATNGICSSTFTVEVQVRPQIYKFNLTWNSNFVEDLIEVCAGAEALSDNDIEILHPITGNLVGTSSIPLSWDPTFLYGPSPIGPWTDAPGSSNYTTYYQWEVDFSVNNRLGYHYFILRIIDPVTGCITYSNPAILNVVSSLTVEAGDPEYLCGGSTVTLSGAYVGGIASSTPQAQWSILSSNPAGVITGLSSTALTSTPASVTYTPPVGYVGEITLRLRTNDPDGTGTCVAIEDYRIITVVPPSSFNGCLQLADWTFDNTNNADGTGAASVDDTEEPCLVTLVGSDNGTGSAGSADLFHCTGAGTVSFDWTFLAPPNKIVWHQEDQKIGASSGSSMIVPRPTNVSEGDLIIVTIHINDNNLGFTPPSGFSVIRNTTHATYIATVASFYKIATASEPASYSFGVTGGSVDATDRIYASRVTGHDEFTPIGNSSTNAPVYLTYPAEGYMNYTIPSINTTLPQSMLVSTLAIDIRDYSGEDVEFINSPVGSTTMYYNDVETTARVAQEIRSSAGATGTRTFSWPSYGTRNRRNMYVAGHTFVINPASNERDEAYFLLNGVATLLGNTNGATGSRTITVNSGDEFGFRAGTTTNTGGPGRLIVYNLEIPNDIPVLTGTDTIFVPDCQAANYTPVFVEPTATDDCGTPVIHTADTSAVVINGCTRMRTITWVYIDECDSLSAPFEQTVVWSVLEPITISCPTDPMLEACLPADTITARYNAWVAGFTATGGCSLDTTSKFSIPPLVLSNIACGDTLSFTFTVSDACGQDTSCTSTFTVLPVDTLIVYCPADTTLTACADTADIRAAYELWKAGFYYDGGCASVTDNMSSFPALTDFTCGGELEFTYAVFNTCGQNASCVSTFRVEPPEAIAITVPDGVSLPLCSNTTDIETAYNAWKAGFSYTGGCNVITNIDTFPALGDITCGGTLSFTYSVRNGNAACEDLNEGTSTFSVAEAPSLILSCPADTTIAGCLGILAITDAYDTWVDGFRATGGCNIVTNIDSIPELGGLICNGSITFTFIVGNDSTLCSVKDSCTSTFTIGAPPAINIVTPPDTVVTGCNTDSTIIAVFDAWKARFDYTGGCAGYVSESDISVYGVPSSCGGSVTVLYSVWDDCSNLVTDSATFTLNPELISVNAPLNEVQAACQTQAAIDSSFAEWKSRFGFSGGCGTIGTDLSLIDAPNACGGTIVVNFSAQDACGQVVNTSAIFTIDAPSNVLQEPSFTNPADVTVYRDTVCNYDADPAITGEPTNLTDNCTDAGNLTMSHSDSIAAGSCSSELLIYRTWTVMDNCLNATTQVQLITVMDTTPPELVCAADVNNVADTDECYATGVAIGSTSATDNCVLASLLGVRSDGLPLTDPYPVGITTITWTATDACGNIATCQQTITITDVQAPDVVCPADVDHDAEPGLCYRTNLVIDNPVVDENCVLASVTWVMRGATTGNLPATGLNYVGGETFNVGITTVTYYAADISGNVDSCSFTVTVHDITPPVITANCVSVSDNADPGLCWKVPATLFDPEYEDTCWPDDSLTVAWVMTGATTGSGSGFVTDSAFNVGVTTVTYTITDPDNNAATCTFTVTILDVTPPVITAGCTSVSETAAPDNCSKIPTTLVDPVFNDTCYPLDSLTISYTITGATTASGTGIVSGILFNVGVSTVTYTVTDPDGNAATCDFTVTIVDVTPPVINLANCVDVTDVAAPDSCSKVSGTMVDPLYSDTCYPIDSLTLSWTMTGATTGSGFGTVTDSAFNVGVTTVTYIVADPDGNRDTCSFTVTIHDVTPPEITVAGCQDATDVTAPDNCSVIPGTINDPVYSDTCWPVDSLTITWTMTGATIRSGSGSVVGELFNAGVTTVTYTVTDPDSNAATCDFTVTIIPFNPPAFASGCPPDVTSTADPGVCEADLTIPDPSITDLCNIGYTIVNDYTGTANASGVYPVGVTLVRWIITPTVGTPDTCYQTVTVTDDEDPNITCPPAMNIEGCDTTVVLTPAFSSTTATSSYNELTVTNAGVATDNCVIDSVTYVDVAAGTCPVIITRTWTVFDAAGNSASCDQVITIGETTPPVASCPPNDSIPSDFNLPYADYSLPVIPYSDNCTDSASIIVTWDVSGVTTGSGTGMIPRPFRFTRGLNTITLTFTDICGNTSSCTFTLFVLFPPDIDCQPPRTYNTDAGVCTHRLPTSPPDEPGVPDNITGDLLTWTYTIFNPNDSVGDTGGSTGVTAEPIDPYDFWLGTSIIRWVGINPSGTDTCTQLITVVDSTPPTFDAPSRELCVEPLWLAVYTGDADNLQYEPDYPDGDYYIFEIGNDTLDIDITTYFDNCCGTTMDEDSIRWTITFDGSEPPISGVGQPSDYIDPVLGTPMDILLWGDGVTFQERVHQITYWITDCNGNESLPVSKPLIIKPRPQLIKM